MEEASSTPRKEYNKTQKVITGIFYILIVIASIVSIGGIVWTFADIFIGTTGKLELFLGLNLGYQIAIIGGLLAGLFFFLVFFFGLFKKTSRSLMVFIYKKKISFILLTLLAIMGTFDAIYSKILIGDIHSTVEHLRE